MGRHHVHTGRDDVDPHWTAPAGPAGPPSPLRVPFPVLAKPTGPNCNLDCEYCFLLSKEALYPGDRFRMADALQAEHLRQFISSQPDGGVPAP